MRTQLEADLTVTPAELEWTLARTDTADADTEQAASALLTCVVRDPDPDTVGRRFTRPQSNSPWAATPVSHHHTARRRAGVRGVHPGYVPAGEVQHVAVRPDGTRTAIPAAAETLELADTEIPALPEPLAPGATRRLPLGTIAMPAAATRAAPPTSACGCAPPISGVGWHTTSPPTPCANCCPRQRNWRSPPPAAEAARGELRHRGDPRQGSRLQRAIRPQARGLGEWLRGRHVDIPEEIL